MKILFICKYNRFRSRAAESLLKHYSKNSSKFRIRSVGLHPFPLKPHISKNALKILAEKNIFPEKRKARKLTQSDIKWADKIIIAANNISPEKFPKDKTIIWPIPDAWQINKKKVRKNIELIDSHIQEFLKKI